MKHFSNILTLLLFFTVTNVFGWESKMLKNENGKLVYYPDEDGFIIPDFSYAGYKMGEQPLPTVAVVETISPIEGDNTEHIQNAIDRVGKKIVNVNGIRGALLLTKGSYRIDGTINVNYDGVILRGEGNDNDPATSTVLEGWGNSPSKRDLIILGNKTKNYWNINLTNKVNITTEIIKVGDKTFEVADASPFKVGDQVIIEHPCTQEWLEAVDYGGVRPDLSERWVVGQLPIVYNRFITAIEGNKITIHAPVFYTLNKSLSQCTMAHYDKKGYYQQIGIENLRVKILSEGGEDENHAWHAVRFKTVENCWANNVIVEGFGQSGFITEGCLYTTIQNCQAIDPVSIITGERRYNYNCFHNSQFILVKDCYAREGRHHYTSNGTSTVSGIVFTNCVSDASNSNCEPHRQWSQGILYDSHVEKNLKRFTVGIMGLYNRADQGTGHGWAAANCILWNCNTTNEGMVYLHKPPTSQNYAIGVTANVINAVKPVTETLGYVEGQNIPGLMPSSLYDAQLRDRLQSATKVIDQQITKDFRVIAPTKADSIYIVFDGELKGAILSIFNSKGELVLTNKKLQKNNIINISDLPRGAYIATLGTGSHTHTAKFRK